MSVTLIVLVAALGMMAVERLWPGRRWPARSRWWLRALLAAVVQAGAVWLAGVAWDGAMLAARPWSHDGLGVAGGAAVGYLAITLVYYFWHRARHEVPLLWRWLHQLHHSPGRIEILTTFYKHPLEMLCNGVLSSAVLYLLVGLGPAAATLAVLATGLAELFYHWNVRTPRWLGYLVQRPESHCVHHERGRHASNYSDLPLWDALFGTLDNPVTAGGAPAHVHVDVDVDEHQHEHEHEHEGGRGWAIDCGFEAGQEARVVDMLRGRVVA